MVVEEGCGSNEKSRYKFMAGGGWLQLWLTKGLWPGRNHAQAATLTTNFGKLPEHPHVIFRARRTALDSRVTASYEIDLTVTQDSHMTIMTRYLRVTVSLCL